MGKFCATLDCHLMKARHFLTDLTYEFANGDVISGNFFMGTYTEGAPKDEASTFSTTFTSHGGWTYTTV